MTSRLSGAGYRSSRAIKELVDQKNDVAHQYTVGCYRFDTDAEYEEVVCVDLCPLSKNYYPDVKLAERTKTAEPDSAGLPGGATGELGLVKFGWLETTACLPLRARRAWP